MSDFNICISQINDQLTSVTRYKLIDDHPLQTLITTSINENGGYIRPVFSSTKKIPIELLREINAMRTGGFDISEETGKIYFHIKSDLSYDDFMNRYYNNPDFEIMRD